MKVLAYTSPARGHLYPLVPILTELLARGHQVSVRTLADEVELLETLGFRAAGLDRRIEAITHDDYGARSPVAALKRSTAVFTRRAPLEAADLDVAIDEAAPDVLIIDANCWGAAAAAERSGRPWASVLPYPAPLPGPGLPPYGPGLAPARGASGRLRDGLLRPFVQGSLERAIRPPLNRLRREVGVPPVGGAADLYALAPLTLYLTAEPFEYPRAGWPASFRLVGPVSYDPPAAPPPWLEAVERPVVLVTTSSEFQDDGELVATALDALADADVFVVATLPSGNPGSFTVPSNARVERFVPHSAVLARAACAVTHGGMGATQKALAAGVPVVVVPFGRDQREVARRAAVSGAGVRLSRGRLSPARLRAAVLDAIERQPAAEALARAFAAAGGAPRAADELELLGESAPKIHRTVT